MDKITNYKTKFYSLLESEMGDVKPLISENTDDVSGEMNESDLMVDPYKLTPYNGQIRISNTQNKQTLVYKLQKPTLLGKVDVDVEDFPMGKYIKVSAVGQTKVIPINKEVVKNTITSNWGKKEIVMDLKDSKIYFVKV